jgi:hypothetical protein
MCLDQKTFKKVKVAWGRGYKIVRTTMEDSNTFSPEWPAFGPGGGKPHLHMSAEDVLNEAKYTIGQEYVSPLKHTTFCENSSAIECKAYKAGIHVYKDYDAAKRNFSGCYYSSRIIEVLFFDAFCMDEDVIVVKSVIPIEVIGRQSGDPL